MEFTNKLDLDKKVKIDNGSQGEVYLAYPVDSGCQGTVFAIKETHSEFIENEVRVCEYVAQNYNNVDGMSASGDGIVSYKGLYTHRNGKKYLVFEFCEGRNVLKNFINFFKRSGQAVHESDIVDFIRRIATIVKQLHSIGVIHRDLKLQNFVGDFPHPSRNLRVIDFGLSFLESDSDEIKRRKAGSRGYCAPEILEGGAATKACDIFSLGVITYIMLALRYPFPYTGSESAYVDSVYQTNHLDVLNGMPVAKDLLGRMLHPNPLMRPNIDQVLKHEWFAAVRPTVMDPNYLRSLRGFDIERLLGKAVRNGLALFRGEAPKSFRGGRRNGTIGGESFVNESHRSFQYQLLNIPVKKLKILKEKLGVRPCAMQLRSSSTQSNDVHWGEAVSLLSKHLGVADKLLKPVLAMLFHLFGKVGDKTVEWLARGNTEKITASIDKRKFLLALASFYIPSEDGYVDKKWTRFCFSLFDADGGGDIDMEEFFRFGTSFLCFIRSRHMQSSLATAVVLPAMTSSSPRKSKSQIPTSAEEEDIPYPTKRRRTNENTSTATAGVPPSLGIPEDVGTNEQTSISVHLLRSTFDLVDGDGSGGIDLSEFSLWVKTLYQHC